MDIKSFIDKLTNFNVINFSENSAEIQLFAKKYDKNKNSLFEKEELQEVIDDLQLAAKQDENTDDLSTEEAKNFIKSFQEDEEGLFTKFFKKVGRKILPKDGYIRTQYRDQKNSAYGKQVADLLNELIGANEKRVKTLTKRLQPISILRKFQKYEIEVLAELSNDEFVRAEELLYVKGRKEQFNSYEISDLVKLSEDEYKRAKELLYIEGREEQFNSYEISDLVKLSEDEYKRVKGLLYIEGREEQLSGSGIAALAKLNVEQFERAKTLFNIEEREEQFDGVGIAALAKLSDKELAQAKTLFNVEEREEQFDGVGIAALAKLSEKELAQAKTLFNIEEREKQFDGVGIAALAKLSKDELKRARALFKVPERDADNQFRGTEIAILAKLSKDEFERAKSLFYVENREEQFSVYGIVTLAELSKEEFERVKSLFYVENREEQFGVYEIEKLAKLSEDEFERAKSLFYVENREVQFDGVGIAALAKLSKEEFEWVKKMFNVKYRDGNELSGTHIAKFAKLSEDEIKFAQRLFNIEGRTKEQLSMTDIIDIAKYYNSDIEEMIVKNPNIELCYTAGNCIKLINDKDFSYTYDKSGLIETESRESIPDTDKINEGKTRELYNKNLRVKQVITEGKNPKNDDRSTVYEEVLIYYDENNNVKQKIKKERNPKNGALYVTLIDKDGTIHPIQYECVCPEDGAIITDRCIVSPGGAATQFYCEENGSLKIVEYKITDKFGEELIYVHQTLERISNNKIISSINLTGNNKDTQIYEIKYTDDYRIIVTEKHKSNCPKTVIDLKKYANDEDLAKLLPTIKQLPGHVLLEFAEKPFKLIYDKDNIQNGFWAPPFSTLGVGNFENTTNEEEDLVSVITHELGHYLDLYSETPKWDIDSKIANNPEIIKMYNEEFEEFISSTTTEQQRAIFYFTDPNEVERSAEERVAETHSILYSKESPMLNMRRFYLTQYFPRTMAAIMKLLLIEEGVKVN